MKPIVIALGGNAIVRKGDSGDIVTQKRRVRAALKALYPIIESHPTVITHGNGPAVGHLLLQQHGSKIPFPLDVLDAETEGHLGYLLQQQLGNFFTDHNHPRLTGTILTQALVSKKDTAFRNPTKFIGPFYTQQQAKKLAAKYIIKKDANRGWRQVVASPKPLAILEAPIIAQLLRQNTVVIAAGGGGIPVIKTRKGLEGIPAVVDKDRASATLAHAIGAEKLIIITSVDGVYLRFGTDESRLISNMHLEDARAYLHAGQFPEGSMGPKIQAAIDFLSSKKNTKRKVIISDSASISKALQGKAGTTILA